MQNKIVNKLHGKCRSVLLLSLPLMALLASCNALKPTANESSQVKTDKFDASFTPLRQPSVERSVEVFTPEELNPKTQFNSGPGVTITRQMADTKAKEVSVNLTGQPITANYHDMPLPVFINEVFGEQLGLSFTLDPQIEKQSDLVTLRIAEQVAPNELFHVALRTLASYGVSVTEQDKLLTFAIDKNATAGETPLLISGRALPDVPESHRPVFMFVPLKSVTGGKVISWVKDALTGKEIEVQEDSLRNAVMLKGKPDVVAQAMSIIEVLDQPMMRGKYSTNIEPAFVKVVDLSKNLKEVLNAEGYDATIKSSSGSIMIIPLEGANQMVVFAASQAILDHVRDWVRQLDRRQQMSIDQGIFTYEARNAEASHIVEILNGVETGAVVDSSGPSRSGSAISDTTTNTPSTAKSTVAARVSGGSLVVDSNRNTIIYKGSGQAWANLLPVIQSLDKAAPSVLIEVLIAEVTLNDSQNTGFEFGGNNSVVKDGIKFGTLGGLAVGATGISESATVGAGFTANAFDSAGKTRAILNMFERNKRAEIRSRPRIMVKSGQLATIDVGTDVPTRGAISTNVATGSATVQSITNAKTGVRLSVKPTVHASGYVDIDIDQSLSEAAKTVTSSIDSPSILNRQIKTTVTLQDGGSILIGGLISQTKSTNKSGVPKFSKIPLLGKLFSNDNDSSDRTELMVMIIPYVIDTPKEGEAITKTIQDTFQKVE
jgi:general secretion pathway protein D